MQKIWAPWRAAYISNTDKEKGCILCDKPKEKKDKANLILYRGRHNFIILNAFPYTPGHLMVAPYRHIGNILDLTAAEGAEQVKLVKLCVRLLTAQIKPSGFNIGMNLGRVAGAGIEGHIHTHVVPRWNGDHNFMTVLADTRVLSEAMGSMYAKLKVGLAKALEA